MTATRDPKGADGASGASAPDSIAVDLGRSDAWGPRGASDGDGIDLFSIGESERYERGSELGRGGMGRVFSAHDRRLGRQVALKEVRPGGPPRAGEARLAAEAQLAAGLDHPGILTIHDAGRDAKGQPFYTMRLIRGRTLTQAAHALATQTERMRLVQPLLAVCHAVAHAHARGIIHRDLKPDNLMVGPHGETQVVDWGLACTLTQAAAAAGGAAGTPGFIAPEVAAGAPASPRSDVYSLGVTLVVVLHAAEPGVDLGRLTALLPPELRAIAARCLDIDPLRRYASAEALAEDLSAWLDGRRVLAHSYSAAQLLVRVWRAFRIPILIGSIGLLGIAAAAWQGYRKTTHERDRAVAAEQHARSAQARAQRSLATAYAQAAESAEAVCAHAEADILAAAAVALAPAPAARGILARTVEGPEVLLTKVLPLPSCRLLRLSPDGSWVLCIQDDAALLLRGDDGKPQWRRPGAFADGIISSFAGRVFLTDLTARGLSLDLKTGTVAASGLLLDGSRNLVAQRDSAWIALFANVHVQLVDLSTHGVHRFPTGCTAADKIAAIAFAPESGTLRAACSSGRLTRVSVARGTESLDAASGLPAGGASALAETPDGTILLGTLDGRVWADGHELPWWNGGAQRSRPIVQSLWTAPDGAIAVGGEGIGIVVGTQHLRQYVRLPMLDLRAVTFVDGRTLVVAAGERLLRYTLGPAAHPVRWRASGGLSQIAVSPDGRFLAAAAGDGTLTVWHTGSGDVAVYRKLTTGVVKSVSFSPAGDRLAVGLGAAPGFAMLRVGSWESLPVEGSSTVNRLGYFASGLLWRSTYEKGIDLVDADGSRRVIDDKLCTGGPRAVAGNQARTSLVFANETGDIVRIDQRDPQHAEFLVQAPWAFAIALSADSQTVALAEASRVRLLDVTSRRFIRDITDPGQRIVRVAFDPTDTLLFATELDRTVRVWRVADGQQIAVLRGHGQRVVDLAFGPGSLGLLSASWDHTVVRWDLGSLFASPDMLQKTIAGRWGIQAEDALRAPIR